MFLGQTSIMSAHLFAIECVLQSSELTPFWVILPFSLSPVTTSKDGIRKMTSSMSNIFKSTKSMQRPV